MGKSFKEFAEETRSRLCERGEYGSSTDLYINERCGVAVIGVQTSGYGLGHDTIYLLREGRGLEVVLDKFFRSGRMFPTSISEDGEKFSYSVKNDGSDDFQSEEYRIE